MDSYFILGLTAFNNDYYKIQTDEYNSHTKGRFTSLTKIARAPKRVLKATANDTN